MKSQIAQSKAIKRPKSSADFNSFGRTLTDRSPFDAPRYRAYTTPLGQKVLNAPIV